ncbi:LysR substrate-binding domain-containing protein [Alloyangia pacifica]|uniref:LysR substrate-binding domain-containing protein n=1 Tax=Alloyangia pacifica TaxID=311180 RepID=UPI001CD62B70|nr:LysR substrate-binding domain-containing protein [Alloyangia pacifica]MCA0997229.1 LysR family transcriptional regulator [Alloyangia pacifica]
MLNVRQIEAFKAVIETGTVSRAASRLCVSQPAISKMLQNLEYDTGLALFERSPGRVRPTGDALLLFEEINRLYRGLDRIETAASDIRNMKGTMLSVGVMPALSTGFIQDLVMEYQSSNSAARLALHARSTVKIVDMLISGSLDIGVSSHPIDDPEIEHIALDSRPYVCVMPRGHRLAEQPALCPADLDGERFINFTPTSDLRTQVDELFTRAGVQRDIITEASMAPSICAMVARGLGVALLNPLYLGAFSELVVCRPFAPTVSSEVRLLLPRHRPRTSQVQRFVELALAHAESLGPALAPPPASATKTAAELR